MTNIEVIRQRAENVRERIEAAKARVGRTDEVTLVAVTKTFPEETVRAALRAGLSDLGENRVQEFVQKASILAETPEDVTPTWHLIGPLQRNKARDAARWFHLFHALDRIKLARRLEKMGEERNKVLDVLIQVNISGEEQKHGVPSGRLEEMLEGVGDLPHLRIRGLMGMAEFVETKRELETIVRPQFRTLRALFERFEDEVGFSILSMGMSGDFEVAIEEGATHVRVGSALFGPRG